jgi:hypothetical protein
MPNVELIAASTATTEILPWAAFASLTVGLATLVTNAVKTRIDRRRNLFSEAYRVVVAWAEMYWRVCRRGKDEQAVVERFHELQEQIDFHQGWISVDDEVMGRAYDHFVREVKRRAEVPIREAWNREPCSPAQGIPGTGVPFDIEDLKRQFLADVRDHLRVVPDTAELRRRYPAREVTR